MSEAIPQVPEYADVTAETMAAAATTHAALEEEKASLQAARYDNPATGWNAIESPAEWARKRAPINIGQRAKKDPSSGLDLDALKRVSKMQVEANDLNEGRNQLTAAGVDVSQIPMENVPQAIEAVRSYGNSVRYLASARRNLEQAERYMARDTQELEALPKLPQETDQPQA